MFCGIQCRNIGLTHDSGQTLEYAAQWPPFFRTPAQRIVWHLPFLQTFVCFPYSTPKKLFPDTAPPVLHTNAYHARDRFLEAC